MKVSTSFFVTENLEKKKERIRKRLRSGKKVVGLYVITDASGSGDILDIRRYDDIIRWKLDEGGTMTAYGAALSREGACELVKRMVDQCLKSQGDADLKRFLKIKAGGGQTGNSTADT